MLPQLFRLLNRLGNWGIVMKEAAKFLNIICIVSQTASVFNIVER